MPYAEGRIFNDADSHIMETQDWLILVTDPDIRAKLHPLAIGSGGRMVEKAIAHAATRRADSTALADAEANLMLRKGWEVLGVFYPEERRRALDLLGFDRQLVFTTFAPTHFWGEFDTSPLMPEVLYGGSRAHNRAIVDFCRDDKRLLPVALVPLGIPELAVKRKSTSRIKMASPPFIYPRCRPRNRQLIRITTGCGGRSREAGVPFVLHVGVGSRQGIPPAACTTTAWRRSPTSSPAARTSAPRTTWRSTLRPGDLPFGHGHGRGLRAGSRTCGARPSSSVPSGGFRRCSPGSTWRRTTSARAELAAQRSCRCGRLSTSAGRCGSTPSPSASPSGQLIEQAGEGTCSCSRRTTRTSRAGAIRSSASSCRRRICRRPPGNNSTRRNFADMMGSRAG